MNWGYAETMAYASLLQEGYGVTIYLDRIQVEEPLLIAMRYYMIRNGETLYSFGTNYSSKINHLQ